MDKRHAAPPRRKLIGAGMFDSGIPDLSTNKKYMEGLGSKGLKQGSLK
jgi:hypothetical protein